MKQGQFSTEEDVKIKSLLPLLEAHGYTLDCCDFEKSIEVHEGRRTKKIMADVVVYKTPAKKVPLICCETKGPDKVLGRAEREQTISYARLLPKIAPLALLTNGNQTQVFRTIDKSRIEELPHRKQLDADLLNFAISKQHISDLQTEAKHELFIIDDVQTFKRLLKACHDTIRNNEGYDPAAAFDELSKVLFCKMYEEKHAGTNRFQVAIFDETLEKYGVNIVQKIFADTAGDPRFQGLFKAHEQIALQDRTLRRMVELFENTDLSLTAFDVKGEAFEYFLGDTFTGGLGQYFTPRNVVQFIVDAVDLKIGQKIIDPFCGTGGFLIHAFETITDKIRTQDFADDEKEKWRRALSDESLYGTDWAERTSQTCKMNMVVHGDGSAGIVKHHGLLNIPGLIEEGQFHVCLTNPPFGSFENDPAVLKQFELGMGAKSRDRVILAMERAIRLVQPGGQIGMVVIDGILNNSSTRYVRDYLRRHTWVQAVIGLAPETFEGYGGRSDTSVLLLEKKSAPSDEQQHPVFMSVAKNTGYAPTGDPIPGNELPDILMDYLAFKAGSTLASNKRSWMVDAGDRLDAGFYRPLDGSANQRGDDGGSATSLSEDLESSLEQAMANVRIIQDALRSDVLDYDWTPVKLLDLVEETKTPVTLAADQSYRLLGVRWWGEGTYVREEKRGREIKATRLFEVSEGNLIYNRLFAFRGSFAIVDARHSGTVVSNEFPNFIVRESVDHQSGMLLRYIVHIMNSANSLALVDAKSSGSTRTSRNRFMQAEFLELSIPMPSDQQTLQVAVEAMDTALALKVQLRQLTDQAKALYNSAGIVLPSIQP